jgi:FPC/CPF motif-containing protein YcgG
LPRAVAHPGEAIRVKNIDPMSIIHDRNPHASARAIANSSYASCAHGTLVRLLDRKSPSKHERCVHGALRSFIVNDDHPCAGARAAFNAGAYRFGTYRQIASADATAGLARDLSSFVAERPRMPTEFATFIAVFNRLDRGGEPEFEITLWNQLQALHDLDFASYDSIASNDPENSKFAFSFAGTAFFVVGMHPHSSRLARRFSWPAMVFNPRSQFEVLREKKQYDRFASVVRDREITLQGSLNPNLDPGNERSEARQYSGRAVEDDWKCPFRP